MDVKKFHEKLGVLFFCLLLSSLPACSDRKAEELYKTAQFEEVQTNWKHAGELYERIVSDYPESEAAGRAKSRLSDLEGEGKYPAGSPAK